MIKVGITHGDINGIGYEVILKTFADLRITELCIPVIYGSTKVAAYHRKALEIQPVMFNLIDSPEGADVDKVNIINCVSDDVKVELGKSTPIGGEAAFKALERATEDLKNGLIDVLVTAPINKHNIQQDDFHFPGHTEYLESKFGDDKTKSLMILAKDSLRVALVTGHLPLSQVPSAITKEKIVETARIFDDSLKRDFSIGKPRIAILSLNPHAGENGLLGSEEQDVIVPAIEELSSEILCFGPYAADGFFGSEQYTHFDGILAMYHDQGLAPFKALAMEDGVKYKAGLPIIRTSPAHVTAFGISGKNEASEISFRNAIYMAIDTYRHREEYETARTNPLRKLYFEKGGDEAIDLSGASED